jgi:hypothetical protein
MLLGIACLANILPSAFKVNCSNADIGEKEVFKHAPCSCVGKANHVIV